MGSNDHQIQIEQLARALAAGAGVVWDRLDPYPGYLRNVWRSQARRVLAAAAAQEVRPYA